MWWSPAQNGQNRQKHLPKTSPETVKHPPHNTQKPAERTVLRRRFFVCSGTEKTHSNDGAKIHVLFVKTA